MNGERKRKSYDRQFKMDAVNLVLASWTAGCQLPLN